MSNYELILYIRDMIYNHKTPNESVYNTLKRHNCDYLIRHFQNAGYQNKLNFNHTLNTISVKERINSCKCIFSQTEFPYAVIKGPVLSQVLYDDPFWRNSKDIDILVCSKDLDKCKQILINNGFIQGKFKNGKFYHYTREEILFQTSLTHQIASFVKLTDNPTCPYIYLDINTSILWGECNEPLDLSYVLSHCQYTSITNIKLLKLSAEMEFVELCLHNYKDMNSLYLLSRGTLTFGLYYDIYLYINNSHIDLSILKEICSILNVGQYIYACLYLVNELFEDEKISSIILELEKFKNESILHTYGLTEEERKPWGISLLDRLFTLDVPKYVMSMFDENEKEKIKINERLL